jgi:hypothetical protein
MTLEDLHKKYPEREAAFPSHLEKPNKDDLAEIQRKYACTFPKSFIQFQLEYCDRVPMGEFAFEGFGWANKNLDPYLNLEELVKDYQELGLPGYLSPFRLDNGDFWCFDTRHPDGNGEFPIIILNHNDSEIERNPDYKWRNFIDWLDKTMEEE